MCYRTSSRQNQKCLAKVNVTCRGKLVALKRIVGHQPFQRKSTEVLGPIRRVRFTKSYAASSNPPRKQRTVARNNSSQSFSSQPQRCKMFTPCLMMRLKDRSDGRPRRRVESCQEHVDSTSPLAVITVV